jgi:hypothetical protein
MPCLIGGALLSYIFLFKAKRLAELSTSTRWLLTLLRFLSLSLLLFFFLQPSLEFFKEREVKKLVVIAEDVSASIKMNDIGERYNHSEGVKKIINEFESKGFETKYLRFSAKASSDVSDSLKDGITNYSALKEFITERVGTESVHSLVLISDGIENKGEQVDYALDFGVPIHCLAVGDSSRQNDLSIEKVYTNDLVYANQYFPLEVNLSSNVEVQNAIPVEVFQNDTLAFDTLLSFKGAISHKVSLNLLANSLDVQKLDIRLGSLINEKNTSNNIRSLLIETINDVQNVLVLSEGSHPDEAFFLEALKSDSRFKVQRRSFKDPLDFEKVNTVLISGLPKQKRDWLSLLNKIEDSELSVLVLPHNNSRITWIRDLFEGQVQMRNEIDELNAETNDFNFFENSKEWDQLVSELSPIAIQLGGVSFQDGQSMYLQSYDGISLGLPMVHFQQKNSYRMGVFLGEGYWKWRMIAYAKFDNNKVYKDYVKQVFKYLSKKKNRRKLQLKYKTKYFENEDIQLKAFAFNDVFELMSNVDMSVLIKKDGSQFESKFFYTKSAYLANLGSLDTGKYSFKIKAKTDAYNETYTGSFEVLANNFEIQDTRARYDLMKSLSAKTKGVFINDDLSMKEFKDEMSQSNADKPIVYTEKVLNSLLKEKWIMLVILALIFTEWIIRKAKGVLS